MLIIYHGYQVNTHAQWVFWVLVDGEQDLLRHMVSHEKQVSFSSERGGFCFYLPTFPVIFVKPCLMMFYLAHDSRPDSVFWLEI